jgi:homoserine dehydrogenase
MTFLLGKSGLPAMESKGRDPSHTIWIVLIGVGLIGKELLRQLIQQSNLFRTATSSSLKTAAILLRDLDIRILGLANSRKFWVGKHHLDIESLDMAISILNGSSSFGNIHEYIEEVSRSVPPEDTTIVVDCSASETVAMAYPLILSRGLHIVAANKKAFSSDSTLYHDIRQTSVKHQRFCLHEASVGAGLPILSTINDMILTGDKIHQIEGVFSGTLSYLFAVLKEGKKSFSEVILEARGFGYTVSK